MYFSSHPHTLTLHLHTHNSLLLTRCYLPSPIIYILHILILNPRLSTDCPLCLLLSVPAASKPPSPGRCSERPVSERKIFLPRSELVLQIAASFLVPSPGDLLVLSPSAVTAILLYTQGLCPQKLPHLDIPL